MKTKLLVILFIMALVYAGCNSKKTSEPKQAEGTQIEAPAPDYAMMIVAKVSVKPEKVKEFTEAAKVMIENSNKEAGCRFYQLYQDPYEIGKFVFVEQYDNQAAVDTHFAAEYFKNFGPSIKDFVAEPAKIKIVSVAKEVNQ